MKNTKQTFSTIRSSFPALASVDGADTHFYFDSAATACVPTPVLDAIDAFYKQAHGSVHRSVYNAAEQTTSEYEKTRTKVASFINAAHSEEIVFTSGTTDSLNMVAHAWAASALEPGDGIIITQAEHHAHYVLWHEFARRKGARVYVLPVDPKTFCIDTSGIDHLFAACSIKAVAVTTSSNVLGPVWGKEQHLLHPLLKKARSVGATIILDAAQSAAHTPIDVQALDCDFLAFSAHKMGGPTGLGVLYARKALHQHLSPYRFGGGMVAAVVDGFSQWSAMPQRLEAGTPPFAQVIGMGALLDWYASTVDFDAVKAYEAHLCQTLITELASVPGLTIVGNHDLLAQEGHVVSFYVDDIHAHDIASDLSAAGCCVRAGDHCASPLTALWNGKPTVRVSFFMYNSVDEVVYLALAIKKSIEGWRKRL
jgi:cysteine desulfurase/selenocysteine lyase